MTSIINTNMASLNTQNNLNKSQNALNTSIQRLSSGMRVNSSKDDAAGYAIASRMDATIRGQTVAIRNANDAVSLSQTAEGALGNIADSLQRMRELAVQAANGTNTSTDRTALNNEFKQLQDEITRVTSSTSFNGINVLAASSTTFQVGAGTSTTADQITVATADMTSSTGATMIAASTGTVLTSQTFATDALTKIDAALKQVNDETITQGAVQNRFNAVINNLQTGKENLSAARSRIMDTDYAAETANLARNQILQQAGMAMLAQANQLPNNVMTLLR